MGMVAGVSGDGPPNCADFFIFWAFDHVSHVISSWRCPATIPTRVSGDGRPPLARPRDRAREPRSSAAAHGKAHGGGTSTALKGGSPSQEPLSL